MISKVSTFLTFFKTTLSFVPTALDERDRLVLNTIRDMPEYRSLDDNEDYENQLTLEDALDGTAAVHLSHAGGELQELLENDLRHS